MTGAYVDNGTLATLVIGKKRGVKGGRIGRAEGGIGGSRERGFAGEMVRRIWTVYKCGYEGLTQKSSLYSLCESMKFRVAQRYSKSTIRRYKIKRTGNAVK